MRRIYLLILMLQACGMVYAQKVTVSGRVLDADGDLPIVQATVQALALPDSTYINGCVTNPDGRFTLPALKAGKYALKFSFVGYTTQVKAVTLSSARPTVNIGTVKLGEDAIMLKEAVVIGQAAQVEVKEDTVQYNVSAYRVPEGSAIEELVKKIPGAEVDDEGNITLNGKDISKILVNGKEFFAGDTKVAMKNLTVDMIDKIKAYDKKSDLSRITGIDDGEEEAVLDLTVKKGMNRGVFGNIDLAGGTEDRYSGKAMVNHFSDNQQVSIMANLNNVNDMGFPGGGGRWGRNNGLTAKKMVGANFAYENKFIETGGNLRFNHDDTDVRSVTSSENFQSGKFGNSKSVRMGDATQLNFDYRLEWKPDSLNNIIFRPRASYSKNSNNSNSYSTSANADPYDDTSLLGAIQEFLDGAEVVNGRPSVLDALTESEKLLLANAQRSQSLSNSKNTNLSGELQYNRRFGSRGRNLTFRVTGGYTDGKSNSFSYNDQWYFMQGNDDSALRRYVNTPTKSSNYSGRVTYSEPIARAVFLQFGYRYSHRFSKSDKNTYDLSDLLGEEVIGFLPQAYEEYRDASLSKYVENNYDNHDISLTLRMIRAKWQLNVGGTYQPQRSSTSYQQGSDMTHLESFTRNYYNFAPTLDFRYNFSKMTRLRIEYRNRASQPNVSDLIPVIDDSNPLSISAGNPELKPSFTSNVRLMFNTYDPAKQMGIMTNWFYNRTSNSVSNKTIYNSVTGGQVSMPMNIDGNWNMFGMLVFNTALKDQRFTVGSFSRFSYNNYASYYNDGEASDLDLNAGFQSFYDQFTATPSVKNITKNMTLAERLNLGFRATWFDIGLNGEIEYARVDNQLQPSANQNTYKFSYGGSMNFNLPWNMSISTNVTQNSRRGYSDDSYNTNELIWNAQITQNLFRGNAATISLRFFDILRQQSNVSRAISATLRQDTEYNAVNSYAMLQFSYRLNLMGGKEARSRMEQRGWGGGPGGRRPGGGFGRPI